MSYYDAANTWFENTDFKECWYQQFRLYILRNIRFSQVMSMLSRVQGNSWSD